MELDIAKNIIQDVKKKTHEEITRSELSLLFPRIQITRGNFK
jgi:hypothetical protein